MSEAIVVAPLALAAVLLVSGLAKRNHVRSTRSVIILLRLPQAAQASWVAPTLPRAEIGLAALLVVTPAPLFWLPAVAVLALMLTYWAVIARAMRFTPRPSCGCFGQIGDQRVSGRTLLRNTLLVFGGLLTLAVAATGRSTLGLLGDFTGGDAAWLIAVCAAVLLTWFVVHRPDAGSTARAAAANAASDMNSLNADEHLDAGNDIAGQHTEELEDYVRTVIPHTVVLTPEGKAQTLRETAVEQAHLMVFVNCYCASTTSAAQSLLTWRERVPAIRISFVWSVPAIPLHAADGSQIELGDQFIDHAGVVWSGLWLSGSPSAVLLGTDGLLAGGPVNGVEEIDALVVEIGEALNGVEFGSDEHAVLHEN